MKDGLTQIIINVEAQKEEPRKYKIVNRAIFYICRIVSSQKGRDFVNSEYDNMKRVYSIWICMNMKEHSLSHIHLEEEQIIGSHKWKGFRSSQYYNNRNRKKLTGKRRKIRITSFIISTFILGLGGRR